MSKFEENKNSISLPLHTDERDTDLDLASNQRCWKHTLVIIFIIGTPDLSTLPRGALPSRYIEKSDEEMGNDNGGFDEIPDALEVGVCSARIYKHHLYKHCEPSIWWKIKHHLNTSIVFTWHAQLKTFRVDSWSSWGIIWSVGLIKCPKQDSKFWEIQ